MTPTADQILALAPDASSRKAGQDQARSSKWSGPGRAGNLIFGEIEGSDEGAPSEDRALAGRLAARGVPAFACTPDLFPDPMAAGAGIAAVPATTVPTKPRLRRPSPSRIVRERTSMIIWSGWGMLSALIAAAGLFGSVLLDPALARLGIPTPTGVVLVWIVAVGFNWWLGTRLNNRPGRELLDPRTGQIVILRARHTLFWIPMQYYSVLMVLLGALAVVGAMHAGSSGRPV